MAFNTLRKLNCIGLPGPLFTNSGSIIAHSSSLISLAYPLFVCDTCPTPVVLIGGLVTSNFTLQEFRSNSQIHSRVSIRPLISMYFMREKLLFIDWYTFRFLDLSLAL